MPAKITTPISILFLCYLMIVSFSFILLCLGGLVAYDLSHGLNKNEDMFVMEKCQAHFNRGDYTAYELCVERAREDYHLKKWK